MREKEACVLLLSSNESVLVVLQTVPKTGLYPVLFISSIIHTHSQTRVTLDQSTSSKENCKDGHLECE